MESECSSYSRYFVNPVMPSMRSTVEAITSTVVWTNAKSNVGRIIKKLHKRQKKGRKGRYYRYDGGTGDPVLNVDGIPVKKGGYKSQCLGYDAGSSKHMKISCKKWLEVICSDSEVRMGNGRTNTDTAATRTLGRETTTNAGEDPTTTTAAKNILA